jgi:hypothetical protein
MFSSFNRSWSLALSACAWLTLIWLCVNYSYFSDSSPASCRFSFFSCSSLSLRMLMVRACSSDCVLSFCSSLLFWNLCFSSSLCCWRFYWNSCRTLFCWSKLNPASDARLCFWRSMFLRHLLIYFFRLYNSAYLVLLMISYSYYL